MIDYNLVKFPVNFNYKEKKILDKILDNYNFKVTEINKVRSVYKLKTPYGNICLKKFKHGKHKARNGNILVEELKKNNFNNTAKYIKTKNSQLFTKYKKYFFYATEWIDGKECDLKNINEAINCMKLLAKFHLTTNKINIKKLKLKNNLKNWIEIFINNLHDMEKFRKIIYNKKLKNEFDLLYMDYIENFYNRGLLSLKLLDDSNYYLLSKKANNNATICHDSFYYQNIIKKDNKYYIIDLDSIIIDLHINDIGKLIRRLMSKTTYKWDFNKAKTLIEAYNYVNKLTKNELEAMIALIIFPHKFWKLGKKRYIKHKNWRETKYMHKLDKIINYNDLEEQFLKDYLNYLQNY